MKLQGFFKRQILVARVYGIPVRIDYRWFIVFAMSVVLIAANLRSVKLDWVFGSTHASLVWIVLAATVLGWLLGITTSILFRHRTRRPVSR